MDRFDEKARVLFHLWAAQPCYEPLDEDMAIDLVGRIAQVLRDEAGSHAARPDTSISGRVITTDPPKYIPSETEQCAEVPSLGEFITKFRNEVSRAVTHEHLVRAYEILTGDTNLVRESEHCVSWPSEAEIHEAAQEAEEIDALDAVSWEEGALWFRDYLKMRSVEDVRGEASQAGREKRDYEMHMLEEERHELRAQNKVLREALEFYGDHKAWRQFISSGNIFDEVDGDPVMAFNGGEDTPWSVAQEALKNWRGE